MAQASFSHAGDRVDYTPGSAVTAGDVVVVGDFIGVAADNIAANTLGSLLISGVFNFAKAAGAIAIGTILYWDATNDVVSANPGVGLRIGPCTKAALSGDTTVEAKLGPIGASNGGAGVVTKDAAYTVTEADNGRTFVATAVDLVFTLPATKNGLEYTFYTGLASTTTGLSISPAAADKINGLGITAADNKDLINTAATDAVGDCVTIRGDGVDGWYVVSIRGTWAREA